MIEMTTKQDKAIEDTQPSVLNVSQGITTEAEGLNFNEFCAPAYQPGVSLKKIVTRVPLVKYPKQKFFKTHPTWAWMGVTALVLKDEDETYLISGAIAQEIAAETITINLFVAHLQSGDLIVIKAPTEDREGKWNSWHKSLNNLVSNEGRKNWIRVQPNRDSSSYIAMEASASWIEPEWPDITLEKVMSLAFDNGERIIRSIDHPVLKALRGAA
jgi:hypothetical protein